MSTGSTPLFRTARIAAFAVAVLAVVALVAQFTVSYAAEGTGSATATLWWMAGYFTVLTNVLVALTLGCAALRAEVSARRVTAVTLAIVLVALVYHSVLSGLRDLEGLGLMADHGLHSAVPVLALMWWLAFAPKDLTLRDLPFWMIWPAAYAVYALTRGALTGFWAYPFLNADALGWIIVARNVAALIATFVIGGLAFIAVARLQRGRSVR